MPDYTRHVKQSFEDRVQTQLEGTYTVHWEGQYLDTEGITTWIEPRTLGFSDRGANAGKRWELWTFQVNCYARVGPGTDIGGHKVYEIADDVMTAFRDLDLDVVDWDASDPKPSVGTLEFFHPSADPVPNDEEGLQQVSVTMEPHFNDLSI